MVPLSGKTEVPKLIFVPPSEECVGFWLIDPPEYADKDERPNKKENYEGGQPGLSEDKMVERKK